MQKGDWAELAVVRAEFALRVTPRARREQITRDTKGIRVAVSAPPEIGKANAAVQALLSHALGVAKSRPHLVRGSASRDKLFRQEA